MRLGEYDLGEPKPLQPLNLEITEHPPDWGTLGDPAATTLEHCRRLGDRLLTGAWFLNPIRTIHSPTDSSRFHQAAAEAQTQWRRALTDNLNCGNKGYRRVVQKVVREAKEVPPEWLAQTFSETAPSGQALSSAHSPPSSLPDHHRIRDYVRLSKQLAVTGIMIIDGRLLEPRDRRRQAGKLPDIREFRRRCDFAPLVSGTDLAPFLEISRNELRLHLAANPNAALYITPGITVVGQSFNSSFLKKARKAESWWHDLTYTEIGKPRLKELAKPADEAAELLFFHGTLVADGRFHRPGRWPNPAENLNHLDQGSPDDPTVSGKTLGLT